MSKKAIISICSTQDIGEKEKIEVVTVGEFSINGDEFIATYDETEISGMEGTKTTLTIKLYYIEKEQLAQRWNSKKIIHKWLFIILLMEC